MSPCCVDNPDSWGVVKNWSDRCAISGCFYLSCAFFQISPQESWSSVFFQDVTLPCTIVCNLGSQVSAGISHLQNLVVELVCRLEDFLILARGDAYDGALEGFKLICHTRSHSSRAERSFYYPLFSLAPFTVDFRRLSSANSLASEDVRESGRSLMDAIIAVETRQYHVGPRREHLPAHSENLQGRLLDSDCSRKLFSCIPDKDIHVFYPDRQFLSHPCYLTQDRIKITCI